MNNIHGNKGIVVSDGGRTYIAKSYTNNGGKAGDIMYDLENQAVKVYDGGSWVTMLPKQTTIELSSDIISILDWARNKRNEEYEREHLAKTNPAIKDLVNQIKEKEEQIKVVQTLINSNSYQDEQCVSTGP